MPQVSIMNQSSESFNALLVALGLWELPDIPYTTADAHKQDVGPLNGRISRLQMDSARMERHMSSYSDEDSLPTDEASLFGREFLSDFEVCSDDESDGDYDTLPSRPGSSLESFDIIEPITHIHQPQPPLVQQQSSFIYPQPPLVHHRPPPPPARPHPPPKPTTATSSPLDPIYLKVAYNASIIMLRIPRDISFSDLKRRLYEKFVNQESLLLSQSFSVVLAIPPSAPAGRVRLGARRSSLATCTEMRFIDCEADWRSITTKNDGSKITLRVLDTPL
ncbi:hypothetical protein M413DRAFT_28353 [Hebeloma cylindrosporum]|uniref:PB1 domain-containing protein n=1 Tax=Hebeloma cylindrosporum TaxID=76867 RepID=A0A0C2XS37_HEBCY|nr:hypothetical protein M413DRAFT_28353 [Hebeloma cylindrosporum h7]